MKIGIIRIDRMGDMILTLPLIKAIKLHNPSTIIHVYCSNKNLKIVQNFNYIDKVFNTDNKFKKNTDNYDNILNFSPGWKSFFISFFLKSNNKANIILTSRYKNKFYSKLLIYFFSKIFFQNTLFINRIDRFNKKQSIHQTDVMFELLKQCDISFKKELIIDKFLTKTDVLKSSKNLCNIHLSSKWINRYYNENNLLELIYSLEKKFNLCLTTDETSFNKFDKIFKKYDIISNNTFDTQNSIEGIKILDRLNFKNWLRIIYSSQLIITPECGCTHIASICKIPTKIIYDADNKPEMIYEEYYPWKNKHEKFIFNEKELNSLITDNL